jgi:hypothetical protein
VQRETDRHDTPLRPDDPSLVGLVHVAPPLLVVMAFPPLPIVEPTAMQFIVDRHEMSARKVMPAGSVGALHAAPSLTVVIVSAGLELFWPTATHSEIDPQETLFRNETPAGCDGALQVIPPLVVDMETPDVP